MNSNCFELAQTIRNEAFRIGFDACGIAEAAPVGNKTKRHVENWLQNGCEAGMKYMANYPDKRMDPRLLVENARSVIVVALNYYPAAFQPTGHPQFAYYAYGKDYHDIMRTRLNELFGFIKTLAPAEGRIFCDTAPVLEKYWAGRAGIGFIGRNTQLIIPGKGSYFFLGEIITTLALPPGRPMANRCGKCRRCIENCPGKALDGSFCLDANHCLSYHTIESREELPARIKEKIGNRVYGCDACQQCCPWNRFAAPNTIPEFQPSRDFLSLDRETLSNLTMPRFSALFRHSAVKRAGYSGLRRNIDALE